MMQFSPSVCPQCGGLPKGTVEDLEGVAKLEADGSGFSYTGYTEVEWNSQKSRRDGSGRFTLVCRDEHLWKARRKESL